MIRTATLADIAGIRECGARLHARSVYRNVPPDVQRVAHTVGQCVSSQMGFAMVGEHGGKITGFMLGGAVPLWYSKKRSASDIATYSEVPGEGVLLIREFVNWAWSVPSVVEVTVAQSSGIDVEEIDRLYELEGLQRVGSVFTAVRPVAEPAEVAA